MSEKPPVRERFLSCVVGSGASGDDVDLFKKLISKYQTKILDTEEVKQISFIDDLINFPNWSKHICLSRSDAEEAEELDDVTPFGKELNGKSGFGSIYNVKSLNKDLKMNQETEEQTILHLLSKEYPASSLAFITSFGYINGQCDNFRQNLKTVFDSKLTGVMLKLNELKKKIANTEVLHQYGEKQNILEFQANTAAIKSNAKNEGLTAMGYAERDKEKRNVGFMIPILEALQSRERADTAYTDDLTVSSSGKSSHSSDDSPPVNPLSQSKINELVEINLNYEKIVEFSNRQKYLNDFKREIDAIDDEISLITLGKSLTTEKQRYEKEWKEESHTVHKKYKKATWTSSDNEAEVNNIKHQYYELAIKKQEIVTEKLEQVKKENKQFNEGVIARQNQEKLIDEFVDYFKKQTNKQATFERLKEQKTTFARINVKFGDLDKVDSHMHTRLINVIKDTFNAVIDPSGKKHKPLKDKPLKDKPLKGGRKTKKSMKPRKTKKPRKYRKKQTRRM